MSATIEKFKAMRPSVRSLVFLYWIYSFTGGMIGIFVQIFLYQKFTSVSLNVVATMSFYTGTMIGFLIPGLLAALWHLNIKRGFMMSFLIMGLSILYFPHTVTAFQSLLAMFLWGIGQGMFWLTLNTFELSETKNEERDFYSSVLTAGTQVLSLAGPIAATLLVWLSSNVFHMGTYTLLFTIAPALYLLGFSCFSSIREYRPERIRWADVVYYFTDHKNQAAQVYTFGTGVQQTLGLTVPPLAMLFILGTALRVGVYNTFFALFSATCILILARYRTQSNRLRIYGITTLGLVLVTAWYGYALTFAALVLYIIVVGILSPVQSVSSHIIDLTAMEIGRSESDFYATMLLRDFFLWVWRCVGGLIFFMLIRGFGTEKTFLSVGLYLLAGGLALMYFGAVLFTHVKQHAAQNR